METTSRKVLRENIKSAYLAKVMEFFSNAGEEVLRVGSAEIAFPVVDEQGNEDFLVITLKIPTGSRDGDVYDGYSMAEDYALKQTAKAEKAQAAAEAKAKKIARDKAQREARAKAKAEREAKAGE